MPKVVRWITSGYGGILRSIIAVVKDTGGMLGVLPVVDFLRRGGQEVNLAACGASSKALQTMGVEYFEAKSPEEVLSRIDEPSLLLTSMCSFGGVGRDLVPILRERGIPTVALQDFWGARVAEDISWAPMEYRPNFVVVNDEVGKKIVLRAWPDFDPSQVLGLGFPALDKFAGLDAVTLVQREKEKYGLDSRPVFYFSGQLPGTDEALREMIAAIEVVGVPIQLVLGKHYRAHDEKVNQQYPGLGERIDEAYEATKLCSCARVIDNKTWPEAPMVAVADLTLGMYPTALQEAVVLRKGVISLFYPEVGERWFKKDTGGIMENHPLVDLGCVAVARNREELVGLLREAFAGDLAKRLRPAQEKHMKIDGRNAERVGNFLLSLL